MIDPLPEPVEVAPLTALQDAVASLAIAEGEPDEHVQAALAALEDPDVAQAALAERDVKARLALAAPRQVHVEQPFATDPDVVDKSSGALLVRGGRRYLGPVDCPDCTRGLEAMTDGLACCQLRGQRGMKPCHEGCIIACGRER
jgi:hypothetical protein